MAKLILTRPRQAVDALRSYCIVIDGDRGVSIQWGQTIGIELPSGRHEVAARIDWCGSHSVPIEAGPEEHHHVEVGSNLAGWHLVLFGFLTGCFLLALLSTGTGWGDVVLPALPVIPCVLAIALMTLLRNRYLYLQKIPTVDSTAEPDEVVCDREVRFSELAPVQPFRARFSIRWMMIAVAFLAIVFGAGVEGQRSRQQPLFRSRAEYHARKEARYREDEERSVRLALGREKRLGGAGEFRRQAAKAAAKADYHAAMRRRYE
jgi:hypothetical protein